MFITAVKTTVIEALNAGFASIASSPVNNSLDLVPNSITIEYPLEEIQWPAILVQFRPNAVRWSGLNPDAYTMTNSGTYNSTRTGYFEGSIDLQMMAMHSEERDRLWDSVTNLIITGPGDPASAAFYSSLYNNDLVGITILPDTYTTLGDSISAGSPWNQDELVYEASVRISCIGDFYTQKYDYSVPELTKITTSGTVFTPPHIPMQ